MNEGKLDKALKALDKCEEEIPSYNVPHDVNSASLEIVNAYIACGKADKTLPILEQLEKVAKEYVAWYLSLSNSYFANSSKDCHQNIYALAMIQEVYDKLAKSDAAKKASYQKKSQQLDADLQRLYSAFLSKCDQAGIRMQ